MYPRLVINLGKLKHNAASLLNLCQRKGISMAPVTKVFGADPKMLDVISSLPFEYMADSRLDNIESYPKNRRWRSMLLRLPAPSEASRVVKSCDVSLNSELFTLERLAKAASDAGLCHGVLLMVDLGDLREGIFYDNEKLLFKTMEFILSQESLVLKGIGVNLTCYGSVLATPDNLQKLCDIAKDLAGRFNTEIKIISGGNSSSLYLLENDTIPGAINNLRLGESMVRGIETAYGKPFAGLVQDVVTLEAEIIEIMSKPSMPEGDIGMNAFGETIHFENIGIRRRAILAIGRQDMDCDGIECLEPGISITGSSSDHLIVDITDAETELSVGDTLAFSLSYGAILAGFTSKYVKRIYVGG